MTPSSMQQEQGWPPQRTSTAMSASVYSDEFDHPDMPAISPLRVAKPAQHPSYNDINPHTRPSKLPLFHQVRSILHRPLPIDASARPARLLRDVKYDEFTGDINDRGRAPEIRPSAYKTPINAYVSTHESRPRRPLENALRAERGVSPPVSILRSDRVDHYASHSGWERPVSPVSPISGDEDLPPSRLGVESTQAAAPPKTPPNSTTKRIKRKPAPVPRPPVPHSPAQHSPPVQEITSRSPNSLQYEFLSKDPEPEPISRFSWTTVAPSIAPPRPSTDTRASIPQPEEPVLRSRFSWSTLNTAMTGQARPESPPPELPPPVHTKHISPPVQSILSRRRPVQRRDRDSWLIPPRKPLGISTADTINTARSALAPGAQRDREGSNGSAKKLPLPPELLTPVPAMSHLQELLAKEQDRKHQRTNIERAIVDLEKVASASPLDVSFAQTKEAKRKLRELTTTLAEVQLEEREMGIAISRARRKDGGEQALWVRRVTR